YIQEYDEQLKEKQSITKMLTTKVTIPVKDNSGIMHQVKKNYRLRINVGRSSGNFYATIRILSIDIPTFEELNLPKEYFESIASLKNGLIIVSGLMGMGKTTTVASALAKIAQDDSSAIGTIEQPIEYVMPQNTGSLIIQREVGVDVRSFSEAIDHYLRDDLNVISVGELKSDADTALATLQIAETGILTFTTI
ncbi:Flp pilus assembly complex ATPase component TadA, partial [Klebsiella pneumoniae]|nr:Flp pilus assembly complex ATPase component TadA [Klebsiella pneumoniae]